MIDLIKNAIYHSQKAQRNYDLSKKIPEENLNLLIYAAANAPSKQNEKHFQLRVFSTPEKIREIYAHTKRFSLVADKEDVEKGWGEIDGKVWQDIDRSVHNSQILSNVLFVFIDDDGEARGGTHMLGQNNSNTNSESFQIYNEQKNFSIGISVGQLILSATLLGYRTGICSAFDPIAVGNSVGTDKRVKLLVGVGFENKNVDRRLHAELYNKDLKKKYRTGEPDEKWQFPSFKKDIDVFLNNEKVY